VQALSYLLNLPLPALAQRALFDHEFMRDITTAHLDVDRDNTVVDKVVDKLMPRLAEEEAEVAKAFQACVNQTQAKDERLFCARGTANGFRLLLRIFVRCCAARPRDAKGDILEKELPICKQFRRKNPIFQHDAITEQNLDFQELLALVREAENKEIERNGMTEGERAAAGLGSPLARKMTDKMASPMAAALAQKMTDKVLRAPIASKITEHIDEVLEASRRDKEELQRQMQLNMQAVHSQITQARVAPRAPARTAARHLSQHV